MTAPKSEPAAGDGARAVCRDPALLLPSFRPRVEAVIAALRAEGFNPKLFETYRSPPRALWLMSTGKSKNGIESMHCLGAAADIVDAVRLWDHPEFFKALGRIGQSYGLTWGGDWDSNPLTPEDFFDAPHLQAVPVRNQNALRARKTPEARDRYIAGLLKPLPLPLECEPANQNNNEGNKTKR